jgi:3-oxoacyl-[acyl-carrier-protein] synthase-1
MNPMSPLMITHYTAVTALGRGNEMTLSALRNNLSGLRACEFEGMTLPTFVGKVSGLESIVIDRPFEQFDCRNNRLALLGLQQDCFAQAVFDARNLYGPERIGIIIGTNSSGMLETEHAYRERRPESTKLPNHFLASYPYTHNMFSVARFAQGYLKLQGPALVISTACSSGAKVFASASRMIEVGICDAMVVGGVDSLCQTNLLGFASLDLLSPEPCRPCDLYRDGISIGEAAGFVLLEKGEKAMSSGSVRLEGFGESTDGYHMTHPHPTGDGAKLAMMQALAQACLNPTDIDYVHLHGTGTRANDVTEDKAVGQVLGFQTPCSSTKGWTGHTLGAAGVVQAVIASLCLEHQFIPGSLMTTTIDPSFTSYVLLENREQSVRHILCNAIGFGGNNCSLILGRV